VIADRTACSILKLFIVIATSRPLNKKSVRCQSTEPTITADLHGANNYCGSASASGRVSSPHTSAEVLHASQHGVSLLTNEPCVFDTYGCV